MNHAERLKLIRKMHRRRLRLADRERRIPTDDVGEAPRFDPGSLFDLTDEGETT